MPEPKKINKNVTADADQRAISENVVIQNGSVTITKGVTKDMGNFNSARVTVGVTLPLNPTEEQIEAAKATLRIANNLVDTRLEREVNKIISEE